MYNTFQNKKSNRVSTNQSMNLPSLDHFPNTPGVKAMAAKLQALCKKKQSSRNQCLNLVPSRKDKFLLLSLGDTTIAVTCPFELIIKTPSPNSFGRCQYNLWTTTTTYQYFLMEPVKSMTPTGLLR